jgi:prophage DNA circulation protein
MAAGCITDVYFAASYKGAAFEAMDISSSFGTRNAFGEFVFSNLTAAAWLGRKIRTFTLSGRLVTSDHIDRTRPLIAAAESQGPGILIHPTLGAMNVVCTSLKVKNNPITDQGWTQLDWEFTEANSVVAGFSIGASIFGFDLSGLFASVEASLSVNYTPSTARLRVQPSIITTTAQAMTQLKGEFTQLVGLSGTQAQYETLSTFDDIIADTTSLKSAATTYAALKAGFDVVNGSSTGEVRYQANRRVVNWAAKGSTLTGVAATSENAVYAAVRLLGGAQMALAALETDVKTLDAALLEYDQVVSVLEGEAEIARASCDDALYLALRKFTVEIKNKLLTRAYTLPALVTYNFNTGVHSLVAAYELFGDAKRFPEIEARNVGNHPYNLGPTVVGAGA